MADVYYHGVKNRSRDDDDFEVPILAMFIGICISLWVSKYNLMLGMIFSGLTVSLTWRLGNNNPHNIAKKINIIKKKNEEEILKKELIELQRERRERR